MKARRVLRPFASHGSGALRRVPALLLAAWLLIPSVGSAAAGEVLFRDDFSTDLSGWETNDADAIAIIDSGDPARGGVLRMRPAHSALYALIRGSEHWPAYRLEGEVLFPTDEQNYLGFIYNLREREGRTDLGSIYIKGNGSYIRVNPRWDWNPARRLYEELKVALTGEAAIVIGQWQRFALEVAGRVCHLYIGDLTTPKVTFPYFAHDSGKAGLKPRVVGGPVWVDNLGVTALDGLSYRGPMRPEIDYQPERMVTDWQVLGPLRRAHSEFEKRREPTAEGVVEEGVTHAWRDFETDPRGAVETNRVVDFRGDRTVAYFRTTIDVPPGVRAELQFSTIDDLTMWRNGKFEGYSYDDRYAWYDFGLNPDHPPSPYTGLELTPGANHVLIRVRGGSYASGGFFAAVATEPDEAVD